MRNRVRNYAWGSTTMLPAIQGRPPADQPEAELWMGAHPLCPSEIELSEGVLQPLSDPVIGPAAAGFPFLLKILTAERALSIQTHPDLNQAGEGFEREERLGIPLDAPNRNYRDRNHKPELMCALTEFYGLCGFRAESELAEEMTGLLAEMLEARGTVRTDTGVEPAALIAALDAFVKTPEPALWKRVFMELLRVGNDAGSRSALLDVTGTLAERRAVPDNRYWWVCELMRQYPDDAGAIAPLYLNLIRLEPGQAVFLGPGIPHAYLHGAGIEIMAASDNVLRAGCTPKHVDPDELARVLRFVHGRPAITRGRSTGQQGVTVYRTPAEEFELHRLGGPGAVKKTRGPAIILNVGGDAACDGLPLGPGESLFADSRTERWSVRGNDSLSVYIAALPGSIDVVEDQT